MGGPAAAADRPAAAVEQSQPDTVAPRRRRAGAAGAVDLPLARRDARRPCWSPSSRASPPARRRAGRRCRGTRDRRAAPSRMRRPAAAPPRSRAGERSRSAPARRARRPARPRGRARRRRGRRPRRGTSRRCTTRSRRGRSAPARCGTATKRPKCVGRPPRRAVAGSPRADGASAARLEQLAPLVARQLARRARSPRRSRSNSWPSACVVGVGVLAHVERGQVEAERGERADGALQPAASDELAAVCAAASRAPGRGRRAARRRRGSRVPARAGDLRQPRAGVEQLLPDAGELQPVGLLGVQAPVARGRARGDSRGRRASDAEARR